MTIRAWVTRRVLARYRRVGGWVLIAGTASVFEWALLRAFSEILGWPLLIASLVAAEVLILAKFLAADRWVFGHARPTVNRLLRYHGASAGALVVYLLVFNGLAQLLGLRSAPGEVVAAYGVPVEWLLLADFVVGTGAAFTWSLATNFLWVWAQPARDTSKTVP